MEPARTLHLQSNGPHLPNKEATSSSAAPAPRGPPKGSTNASAAQALGSCSLWVVPPRRRNEFVHWKRTQSNVSTLGPHGLATPPSQGVNGQRSTTELGRKKASECCKHRVPLAPYGLSATSRCQSHVILLSEPKPLSVPPACMRACLPCTL